MMYCNQITLRASDEMSFYLDVYCPETGNYQPKDMQRMGVVICGGGGYTHIADRETEPVALRFVSMGCNAYVLHYHVAPYRFPLAMRELAIAIAHIRNKQEDYHQHPGQIAAMGFSAGGHLVGSLAVHWHEANVWASTGLCPAMVKPNAQVLCYPVITASEFAHRGSFVALTGSLAPSEHSGHALENLVTPNTPPTFIWSSWTDTAVPCENTLLMVKALRRAGVKTEAHIYSSGMHGVSLGNEVTWGGNPEKLAPACADWPDQAYRFLKEVFQENTAS